MLSTPEPRGQPSHDLEPAALVGHPATARTRRGHFGPCHARNHAPDLGPAGRSLASRPPPPGVRRRHRPCTVKRAIGASAPQLMCTDPLYGVGYDPAWRTAVIDYASGRRKTARAVGAEHCADSFFHAKAVHCASRWLDQASQASEAPPSRLGGPTFSIRPAKYWRSLWRRTFRILLSVGRSGRI